MATVDILPTTVEPLRRTLTTSAAPSGLTGATVRCDVSRISAGAFQLLDFSDLTFKAPASVVTRYRVLAEVSAANAPGRYAAVTSLDVGAIVGGAAVGDVLTVTYYVTAPITATLDSDELRVVASTSTAGLALEATLTAMKGATFNGATDSLEALRDRGDAAWITATGFAVPGSAMTLAADAITAASIAAGAIGVSEAPLLANLDAAVSTRATAAALVTAQADITTLVSRVDVASSTLATAAALTAVATDVTKSRRALWNRRTLTSLGLFTLYADDAVTALATATVTDKDGAAITLATGDAARTTALV